MFGWVQNMSDSMFTETEMAQALREIRMREPRFDMVLFLRSLKADVPTIIKAYLLGDLPVLKEHCSKQLLERFSGIIAAQKKEVCLLTCMSFGTMLSPVCLASADLQQTVPEGPGQVPHAAG